MAVAMKGDPLATPYQFHPKFERAVVFLACADMRFYGLVGHRLESNALANPTCRLCLDAAHAIAKDLGHGPGNTLLVIQRLSRWRTDGKVTHDDVLAADTYLEEGEAAHLQADLFVNELVPIIRQRMRDEATREMITASASGVDEDIAAVEDKLTRARALGRVEQGIGTKVSRHSFDEIVRARYMDRLPMGIAELDVLIDGGVPRGTLTVALGDQKSGKSMFSSHLTASTSLRGQLCAYASLEVPRHAVLARIKANLTGVPTNALLNGDVEAARQIMEELEPRMGPIYVQNFPAKSTKVADLRQWVDQVEQAEGRKLDLLVVDYLDKVIPPRAMDKVGSNYAGAGSVYEDARVWAEQKGFWCFSPTQSTGRDKGRGKHKGGGGGESSSRDILDMGDEADSVEKSRVADLFITLNPRNEGKALLFYVAGNRHGASRLATTPIPVDFACGRIAPVDLDASAVEDW